MKELSDKVCLSCHQRYYRKPLGSLTRGFCENIPKIVFSVEGCILKSSTAGIDFSVSIADYYLLGQEKRI